MGWELLKNAENTMRHCSVVWWGSGVGAGGGPDLTVGAVWGGYGREVMAST